MPTKHQLEQQLEEYRADLEAERDRHNRCKERESELSRKLRTAIDEQSRADAMCRQQMDLSLSLQADVARLGGMLDGMREVLTSLGLFGKGEA